MVVPMNTQNNLLCLSVIGFMTLFSAIAGADEPTKEVREFAEQAIDLCGQASRADWPTAIKKFDEAIAICDNVLVAAPKWAEGYRLRGRTRLQRGKIDECIADFDQFAKLEPKRERELWERGIAYYYAGKFQLGAKQFERYQEYHDADVENSAWRYLCMTRTEGVEKARAALFDIKGERRVPLVEVLALYAGKGSVDDVLAAVAAGDPPKGERALRQFFADLYLGIYYEAAGDADRARKHLTAAADNHKAGGYMGDVARVHVARLPKKN
jgi:lipoprotein NlpI